MNRITSYRQKAKVTQSKLADAISVTQGALGHYESGRRTPSLATARKIVEALNKYGADVTLDDVFPPKDKK